MTRTTRTTRNAALALLLAGITAAHAGDADTKLRLGFGGSHDLGNGFRLDVATEQRWQNDLGTYHSAEYDIGVNYKVNNWLAVAPVMRLTHSRSNGSANWAQEYRPMINATLSATIAGWKIDDRSRLEFRTYDNAANKDDIWRYRNRVRVTSPWKWTKYAVNPYASIEINQTLNGTSKWQQNLEAAIGVNLSITKDTSMTIYYMAEINEDKADGYNVDGNVIGMAMSVKL